MKSIYFLLFITISFNLLSQDQHCGTDLVMKKFYDKNPALKLRKQKQDELQRNSAQRPAANATYVIPIVFHVLHMDGPENISDAQVKDALRILNRDFAKKNPDTTEIIPPFKNLADSMKIQFQLATKDPLGNCTNGIVHYYDTDTDWDENSVSLYSHTWDPIKYLNVYVVRTITFNSGFGAAGYTYFPGTFTPGDPWDAIVVLNNYFGSIGTSNNFTSRVLTHEVGHWLDLYHVFGGTNNAGVDCLGDDYVNDTPTTIGYLDCPNPSMPGQYQLCTPGVNENFQNYMDYSYCCRMFTPGQGQRMQLALQNSVSGRDNLCTTPNLVATGIINPTLTCVPVADFKYKRAKACINTPVQFTDASWKGQPTSYNWTFPGGTPATSTSSAPIVTYANPGVYSVVYSTANSAGTSVPVSKSNIITITNNTTSIGNTWTEGFENLSTLSTNWTIETASGAVRWEQSNDASYSGVYSAQLPPANNTRRTVTSMISPAVNLTGSPAPYVTFRLATAEVTPNHVNALKVYVSADCGTTWSLVYNKNGQALVTSTSSAANFIPTHNEWRLEAIVLQQFTSATYLNFKFEYTRDTIRAANNIFIDDINLTSATGIDETTPAPLQDLRVYPVPSKGNLTVSFYLEEAQKIKFSVFDISGRLVESAVETEFAAGAQKQVINLENKLPQGIYFLNIEIGKFQFTRKIILSD